MFQVIGGVSVRDEWESVHNYIDDIIWEKPDGSSSRAVKFSQHRRYI